MRRDVGGTEGSEVGSPAEQGAQDPSSELPLSKAGGRTGLSLLQSSHFFSRLCASIFRSVNGVASPTSED